MSFNPYESPETVGKSPEPKPGKRKFTLVELLVVIGVIAILIGLLLPARRGAGEAARRSICNGNLRQIATALHNYQSEHKTLPPAYTVDADGKPLHSWRTLLLPYLEQQPLYDKIDLTKPWDDPANKAAFETDLQIYRCPSTNCPASYTTYLAVVTSGGCFQGTEPTALADVTDRQDLTLMVVEVGSERAVHWMSPRDANEELILNRGTASKLPHQQGAQAACVDGSTRFLPGDTKPAVLRAMITIAGGDDSVAQAAD
jgi:type II secretory pathway pseudopilin PulG